MQTGIGGGDHEEHTVKPCFRVSDFSKFLVVISVY
jgi:hypothetical protein